MAEVAAKLRIGASSRRTTQRQSSTATMTKMIAGSGAAAGALSEALLHLCS